MQGKDRHPLWRPLRQYFLTGLFALLPVIITLYIAYRILALFDEVGVLLGVSFPGFGLLVTLVFITLFGMLISNILGQQLVAFLEWAFARVPVLRSIYDAIKQIVNTLFDQHSGTGAFKRVVLVPFAGESGRSIGFVVREQNGHEKVAVFVPFSPPTAGFLVFYRPEEVEDASLTVEEAMKILLSGGTLLNAKIEPGKGSVRHA